MSNLIEEAIREHWGERCPDFDPGCLGCLAWKAVDELASLRSDNERLRAEIERLRAWNAEIALNARHFAEALRKIADHPTGGVGCNPEGFVKDARAALEESRT